MKLPRHKFFHLTAGAAVWTAFSAVTFGPTAFSQVASTIKFVVPVPPGGALDLVGRQMAEQIGKEQGARVVVENRPGAANVIAMEAVARAAPDGNTVLINGPGLAITPHLRKVDFDPFSSFEPICYLVNSPTVLSVNSSSPYRSLADIVSAARTKPGSLSLASVGPGTPFHIGFELLKRSAGVNMNYITYPGSAPAITALLGDHVTAVLSNYIEVIAQAETGKLRILATATPSRLQPLPNVQTFAETGYKEVEADVWFGTVLPAHTPRRIVDQYIAWFTKALQSPEIKSKLAAQQLYPVGLCGNDYADFIRKRFEKNGQIIREAGIKGE
jgi:tripartite-type tricarboxylate transporter receptor subunit TctC